MDNTENSVRKIRLYRVYNRIAIGILAISALLLSGCTFADMFPTSGAQADIQEMETQTDEQTECV